MSMQFKNPAEAFAALATVTVAADQVCTMEERSTLFEQTRHLDAFQHLSLAAFARLLADAVESVYSILPWGESSVSQRGIADLIEAARAALNPDQRGQAFRMALDLASADQLCDPERALLDQLRCGLFSESVSG